MPRIDIPFVVENQTIKQTPAAELAAGGKNYFYATFTFNELWDDIENPKATFSRLNERPYIMPLTPIDGGYECEIPWEVMQTNGMFSVGVFAGEEPKPPTPDWFNSVDEKIAEMVNGSSIGTSEGKNSVIQKTGEGGAPNRATANCTAAFGIGTVAGGKCLAVKAICKAGTNEPRTTPEGDYILQVLLPEGFDLTALIPEGVPVDMVKAMFIGESYSIAAGYTFDNLGKITDIDLVNGQIYIDKYPPKHEEKIYDIMAGLAEGETATLWLPSYPDIGVFDTGEGAHAEGVATEARHTGAHAEGRYTKALSLSSHSEGVATEASGYASHAEGDGSLASNAQSHAEGYHTEASGDSSHSEGIRTKAKAQASHAEGYETETDGFATHAEGVRTVVSGGAAHAEGYETKATGDYSHAEGEGNRASGYAAHAEGGLSNINGKNSEASGKYSHAEGGGTLASGGHSHAEGNNTIASSECAHAEGQSTTASGWNSHAEGGETKATAGFAHSEGYRTEASGDCSHAGGEGSKAQKRNSFVHGNNLTADAENQTVVGQYNAPNTEALFIVGNGTDSNNRSNAFEVYKDGTIKVKIGGNMVSLDTLVQKLAALEAKL